MFPEIDTGSIDFAAGVLAAIAGMTVIIALAAFGAMVSNGLGLGMQMQPPPPPPPPPERN